MTMFSPSLLLAYAGAASAAASLASVCTSSYVASVLPDNIPGITLDSSSVAVNAVYNYSATGQDFYPDTVIDFCNVTIGYTHNGRNDSVLVRYWLPAPSQYQNRFLTTGGGGLAINSGTSSLPGGVQYGATSGETNGGFGEGFSTAWDAVFLYANNTVNWESVYMFGYQAFQEMTIIGKELNTNFYKTNGTKVYTYYQGCSEGGREGFSQVQRFPDVYDGAVIGAPALRYSFQQVNHLQSNIVEQTLGYYPPPCELSTLLNLTLAACDPLDGKVDGVVSRTDLCWLQLDLKKFIGEPYYCAAEAASTGGPGPSSAATPAQNGTISAQAIEVAETILAGLKDSEGRQIYLSYTISSTWNDADTTYNTTSGEWGLDQSGLGGEWVERFLNLQDADELPTLANVTYDTLKEWMILGLAKYSDSLQTTWPDLRPWRDSGNKIIHFHGESDGSIPTAASVRYWDSVRKNMYPGQSFNKSSKALSEFYKFYSIPGASHCGPNSQQPNGGFPQTNLAVMIDWVEKGIAPTTLNATVLVGDLIGENRQICEWPLRPLWVNNGTKQECVYDQKSLDTWFYDLNAIPVPVY